LSESQTERERGRERGVPLWWLVAPVQVDADAPLVTMSVTIKPRNFTKLRKEVRHRPGIERSHMHEQTVAPR